MVIFYNSSKQNSNHSVKSLNFIFILLFSDATGCPSFCYTHIFILFFSLKWWFCRLSCKVSIKYFNNENTNRSLFQWCLICLIPENNVCKHNCNRLAESMPLCVSFFLFSFGLNLIFLLFARLLMGWLHFVSKSKT